MKVRGIGSKYVTELALIVIVILGAVMRFYHYADFSLSNDELSALSRLRYPNFSTLIKEGIMIDGHPAGVQVFLYYWTKLFGDDVAVVRLPFVISGILSIPAIYYLASSWFSKSTGLLSAAALAVLQFPILFSQIARPYSPGLLFSLLFLIAWTKVTFVRNESISYRTWIYKYAAMVITAVLCMYTHYFAFLLVVMVMSIGVFYIARHLLFRYLIAFLTIFILYLPHLEIFLSHFSIGGVGGSDGWLGLPDKHSFENLIEYCLNNSDLVYYTYFLVCVGFFVYYRKIVSLTRYHLLALLFFILPFAVAFVYSIKVNPVLQPPVFLFYLPFLLMFLFAFVPSWTNKGLNFASLLLVLIVGFYSTVYEKKYYAKAHFSEFKGLSEGIVAFIDKHGDENIAKAININHPYYIQYFFDKMGRSVEFQMYKVNDPELLPEFAAIVSNSDKPYFVYAHSNVYNPPEVEQIIQMNYPYLLDKDTFLNSGVAYYSTLPEGAKLVEPVFELNHGFETIKFDGDQFLNHEGDAFRGKQVSKMDSIHEYGSTFKALIKEISVNNSGTLKATLWAKSPSDTLKAQIVCSIENGKDVLHWQAGKMDYYVRKSDTWTKVYYSVRFPKGLTGDETLKFFIWNRERQSLLLDEVSIRVFPD